MAKNSYIKLGEANEMRDQLNAAGEAYSKAAMLEVNFEEAQRLLKRSNEVFLMDGSGERGIRVMKKFAKKIRTQ